jgi:hypothetical protein
VLSTFKTLIANQMEAALCTLHVCIERCPDTTWDSPVVNYRFCQVAFHTLFYADFYLGYDEASFRQQPFHLDHPQFFGDYEEFEDREPVSLYDKPSIHAYVAHCRAKAAQAITEETEESLRAPARFERRRCSRAELYVYNVRHIQHHAANLGLILRMFANGDIPWIASGWRDV